MVYGEALGTCSTESPGPAPELSSCPTVIILLVMIEGYHSFILKLLIEHLSVLRPVPDSTHKHTRKSAIRRHTRMYMDTRWH